jgi:hypothetical protein
VVPVDVVSSLFELSDGGKKNVIDVEHVFETEWNPGFPKQEAGEVLMKTRGRGMKSDQSWPGYVCIDYKKGNVSEVSFEGYWRWRLGTTNPNKEAPDEQFDYAWSSEIRELVFGPTDKWAHDQWPLEMEPEVVKKGETVRLRGLLQDELWSDLAFKPEHGAVEFRRHGAESRSEPLAVTELKPLAPGSMWFTGDFRPGESGLFDVYVPNVNRDTALGWLIVEESGREMQDVRPDVEGMRKLAETTGGKAIEALPLGTLPERIREAVDPEGVARKKDAISPGLDSRTIAWLFVVISVVLGVEWLARRREGLR